MYFFRFINTADEPDTVHQLPRIVRESNVVFVPLFAPTTPVGQDLHRQELAVGLEAQSDEEDVTVILPPKDRDQYREIVDAIKRTAADVGGVRIDDPALVVFVLGETADSSKKATPIVYSVLGIPADDSYHLRRAIRDIMQCLGRPDAEHRMRKVFENDRSVEYFDDRDRRTLGLLKNIQHINAPSPQELEYLVRHQGKRETLKAGELAALLDKLGQLASYALLDVESGRVRTQAGVERIGDAEVDLIRMLNKRNAAESRPVSIRTLAESLSMKTNDPQKRVKAVHTRKRRLKQVCGLDPLEQNGGRYSFSTRPDYCIILSGSADIRSRYL